MKFYLICLIISFILMNIVTTDMAIYIKKHYIRIKKAPFEEKVIAKCKMLILIALIIPSFIAFISDVFGREAFFAGVDRGVNTEYWKER